MTRPGATASGPGTPTAIGGAVTPGRDTVRPAIGMSDKQILGLGIALPHSSAVLTELPGVRYAKTKAEADAKRDSEFEMKQVAGRQVVGVVDGIKQTIMSAPPDVAAAAIGPLQQNQTYQALLSRFGNTDSRVMQAKELNNRLRHQLAMLENASRGPGGSDQSQKIAGEAAGAFMRSDSIEQALQIIDDAREGFSRLHGLPIPETHAAGKSGAVPSPSPGPYQGPGQLSKNPDGSFTWSGSAPAAAAPAPSAQPPARSSAPPADNDLLTKGGFARGVYDRIMSPREKLNVEREKRGLPPFTGSTHDGAGP
jgi:hypothetical protein